MVHQVWQVLDAELALLQLSLAQYIPIDHGRSRKGLEYTVFFISELPAPVLF